MSLLDGDSCSEPVPHESPTDLSPLKSSLTEQQISSIDIAGVMRLPIALFGWETLSVTVAHSPSPVSWPEFCGSLSLS